MGGLFSPALEHLLVILKINKLKKKNLLAVPGRKQIQVVFVSLMMHLQRITHAGCLASRKIFTVE